MDKTIEEKRKRKLQVTSSEHWIAQYCNVSGSQCTIVILVLIIITVGVLQFDQTGVNEQGQGQGHHFEGMPPKTHQKPQVPRRPKQPPCQPNYNIAFYKAQNPGTDAISNLLYRLAIQKNLLVPPFSGSCFRKEGFANTDCPLNFLSDIYYSRLGEPNVFIENVAFNDKSSVKEVAPKSTFFTTFFNGPFATKTKKKSDSGSHGNRKDGGKETDWKPWFPWKQLCQESNEFQNFSKHCINNNRKDCVIAGCKETIRKNFPLIMMSNYMTESMVLIRRKMCWRHEDIVYAKMASPSKTEHEVDAVGAKLFTHFNKTFWNAVHRDPDIMREIKHVQKIQYVAGQFCDLVYSTMLPNMSNIYELIVSDKEVPIPRSSWGPGFKLDTLLCIFMKIKPPVFHNIFLVRMFPEICKFVPNDKSVSVFEFRVSNDMYDDKEASAVVHMNPAYCSPLQTRYRIPLKIMEYPEIYDIDFDKFKTKESEVLNMVN